MAVVIARSRPVAQVVRLLGTLVAMLMLMAAAVGISQWRSSKPSGSPYGALGTVSSRPEAGPPPAPPVVAAPVDAPSPPRATAAEVLPATPPVPAAAAAPAPADTAKLPPRVISLKGGVDATPPRPVPPTAAAPAALPTPPPEAAPVIAKASAPLPAAAPPAKPEEPAPTGLININRASVEELNRIPGAGRIGRTIARHRPYATIQELIDRRVLRASDFARIRAKITAN